MGLKQLNFRICTFFTCKSKFFFINLKPNSIDALTAVIGLLFFDLINTMITLQLQTIIFSLYICISLMKLKL